MLVNDDPGLLEFYPASLLQFSTRGPIHNHTPLADAKVIPNLPGFGERTYPIFRFYLDGLAVHIHNHGVRFTVSSAKALQSRGGLRLVGIRSCYGLVELLGLIL
jgi:hypothetical protein